MGAYDADGLPASPSGRIPQWVRDEAGGRPAEPEPWRAWPSPSGASTLRRPPGTHTWWRSRPRRTRLLSVAVVAALVLGGAYVVLPGLLADTPSPVDTDAKRPTPGREASTTRLGEPVDTVPGVVVGEHGFLAVQPVAYDPCRPIHYVVRPDNAPSGGDSLLSEAFDRVGEVTGLRFVDDGDTDEEPSYSRESFQPGRYGDRWAPVLVTWETDEENSAFAETVVGTAFSETSSAPGGPQVYVTGQVALSSSRFDELLAGDRRDRAKAIVLHELGHLVGLEHVDDETQLMYPEAGEVSDYQSGDLIGLARLGRGSCVPGL